MFARAAEVTYGWSLTVAAAAMISLDGGLRACTGPPPPRQGGKGKRQRAVSGLEEFSSCVAAYFGTELVRNSVEIQLLFSARRRKGNATLDRNDKSAEECRMDEICKFYEWWGREDSNVVIEPGIWAKRGEQNWHYVST